MTVSDEGNESVMVCSTLADSIAKDLWVLHGDGGTDARVVGGSGPSPPCQVLTLLKPAQFAVGNGHLHDRTGLFPGL